MLVYIPMLSSIVGRRINPLNGGDFSLSNEKINHVLVVRPVEIIGLKNMTEEEKKAVEAEEARKAAEAAAAAPKVDDEKDIKDEIIEALGKDLNDVKAQKENYRKGLLIAKGKKPEEETEDERIARIVEEKLLDRRESELLKQRDDRIKELIKENKELKVAKRANNSMESKSGGGNQERGTEVTQDPLSTIPPELKARIANLSDTSKNKLITKWRAEGKIK